MVSSKHDGNCQSWYWKCSCVSDRTHGKEFCQEFEDACTKMDDFVECVTKEIKDRTSLIEMLEQSELYYDTQYGEAKIVANVSLHSWLQWATFVS